MKTTLTILSIILVSALIYIESPSHQPMTESYKMMRIKALTKIRNEMVIKHDQSRENEIRYIEDMISSIENEIEIQRDEIGEELTLSR